MNFCWFTSFIGYPSFFQSEGRGADLARAFMTLGDAAEAGTPYVEAKALFPELDSAQVETKKAAFQEFGLLYVVPRSNTLTLTGLGHQVRVLCTDRKHIEGNRRQILLSLGRALARYQFDNPIPVGGNRKEMRKRAASSDVLPYLACFYLLHKLGGVLSVSELRGAIFGLQRMSGLRALEESIKKRRASGSPFRDIVGLPSKAGTADNLRIYFVSHLSLDNEIMTSSLSTPLYGGGQQVYELTQLGLEVTESVLETEWPSWRSKGSTVPRARKFENVENYFAEGVGQVCPDRVIEGDLRRAAKASGEVRMAVGEAESEALKELPHREYKEGRQRLVERQGLELPPTPEAVMLNSGVGAELTVARDVEKHGWAVTYRGSLRGYGYDLEAKRADTTLRIEVKSSVDYCVPTLTQEEWRAAQEHADDFVLAVVDFFGSERQRIYYVRNPAANLRPAERNVLIYPLRRAEVLRIATDEIS